MKNIGKITLGLCALPLIQNCKHQQEIRPNIILIMADDMGYSDIGCYGGEINTPNLNRLAENGLRFSQFYNGARSCPTRASLLTGLYPHQTGIGHMTSPSEKEDEHDYGIPGYRGYMNQNCVTIAEVLKDAGYSTMMAGKWHLGYFGKQNWPLQRGFDKYYGIIDGGTNYFNPQPPRGLTLGNEHVDPGDNFYITDAFTDYAINFISETREENHKPFFLYLAYTSPHWPLHARKEDIDKYRNRYLNGWEMAREERLKTMKNIEMINENIELSPHDSREWDSITVDKKQEMDLRMSIYAAQIDRMDQNIGRLMEVIRNLGELDNTLILFLSDNGGCAEGGELGGGRKEDLESDRGWVLSYGRAWANVSNTPFREYKHWVHEGGISTPLIVHWPDGMATDVKGRITDQYGFIQDVMATFIDVAKASYPIEYKGNPIPAPEGKSFLHLIKGIEKPVHKNPIFWEHEGNCAVRDGNYKLVQKYEAGQKQHWELYDIETDRSELNDLAISMPDKAKELSEAYYKWAESHYVVSWDTILSIQRKKARLKSGQ
jgi:arylsulfatase